MPKITFLPQGVTVECADGESVFEVGQRHGIPINTSCVGQANCGLCRVKIIEGAEFLPPFNEDEKKHLGNVYHATRVRLSCQSRVTGGDVTVEVPEKRKKKPR